MEIWSCTTLRSYLARVGKHEQIWEFRVKIRALWDIIGIFGRGYCVLSFFKRRDGGNVLFDISDPLDENVRGFCYVESIRDYRMRHVLNNVYTGHEENLGDGEVISREVSVQNIQLQAVSESESVLDLIVETHSAFGFVR
jgi:hypothetical protein